MTVKALNAYRAEMWQQPIPAACPECGGTGYVKAAHPPPGHPQFGKIEFCQVCNTAAREKYLSANCGLNEQERLKRVADWTTGQWVGFAPEIAATYRKQRLAALRLINETLSNRTGFHTFYGDFGAGKTLALQIVANEMRLRMVESFYAPFAVILDHLRSLYSQKQETSGFWQRLLDIPILCLDEITRFSETPWAREKLFVLVDTRYRRQSSALTLFATNENPHQYLPVEEDIGYVYSRMRQGTIIELRGDMRT